MKKLRLFNLFLVFLVLISCSGCAKKEDKNTTVASVMDKIKKEVSFEGLVEHNAKDIATAERYGYSIDDIEEGMVFTTNNDSKADEIILLKAKSQEVVQNIERSLNAEVDGLKQTWESVSESEYEKVKNHIVKTRGKYITLIVTNDPKKIEKVFDDMV